MENENIENLNSPNEENAGELENLDADALKEKFQKLDEEHKKLSETNRQLFERAKKAEGFEKKDDKWVKIEKKEKPKVEKSEPDKEFGLLEKSFLRSADIIDEDEIGLVKKLMEETGKEIDVLIETKYFKSELEELRAKKTIEKATSDIKGGRGETKAVNTPEYWIAKGTPPTAEQVPDRKTRAKIARAMMASAATGGKKFYND